MTYQNDPPNDSLCLGIPFICGFGDAWGYAPGAPGRRDSLESAFLQERTLEKYLECQAWFSFGKVTSSISQNDVFLDNKFFGMDGNGDFHQFFHGKDVETITQTEKKHGWKRWVTPFMRLILQLVWGIPKPSNSGE